MNDEENMLNLKFEFRDDGSVNIMQDMCGNEDYVLLHPMQLRLLAERAGLLDPAPPATWPRGFQRRVMRLRGRASDLHDMLRHPPFDSAGDDVKAAAAMLTEFDDLLADYFDDGADVSNAEDGVESRQFGPSDKAGEEHDGN